MNVSWKVDRSLKVGILTKSRRQTAASGPRVQSLATTSHAHRIQSKSLPRPAESYKIWLWLSPLAPPAPHTPLLVHSRKFTCVWFLQHFKLFFLTRNLSNMLFPLPEILSSCSPPDATSHPLVPDPTSPSSLSSNVTFREVFLDLLIYPSITPPQLHSLTVFLNPLPVSHVIKVGPPSPT